MVGAPGFEPGTSCAQGVGGASVRLSIYTEPEAERVYAELKANFDSERLQDGNVILVIDDISKQVSKYLIDMRVQSITKADLLKMAASFEDPDDREKVLRIVYEEFRRE